MLCICGARLVAPKTKNPSGSPLLKERPGFTEKTWEKRDPVA